MVGKICFLTGGTGFVGSSLAVDLLRQRVFVVFLSRAKGTLSAETRIKEALEFVDSETKFWQGRYRVVEGDVTKSGLNLSSADKELLLNLQPCSIFHSAGSVDFAERNRRSTEAINYTGTANVLRLAEELRIGHFYHMSTLYVAGNRTGEIFENQLYQGQAFNNAYEESKAKAEDLIQHWSGASGIPYSIYRLPIIIGNSQTGKTSTFNGFYGFFKPFWRLENSIRKKVSDARFREAGIKAVDGHIEVPLFVKCLDSSSIDLVPIDWITQNIIRLSNLGVSKNSTFHLSHDFAPSSTSVIKDVLPLLGLEGIRFVNGNKTQNLCHNNKTLKAFQRMVNSITEIYFEYATSRKIFNKVNVMNALNEEYYPPPKIDKNVLEVIVDFAKDRQFEKPLFV